MEMSETAFVIVTYVLLTWFIVSNFILAGYSFKEWFVSTFKQPKSEQKNHQSK
ncbi:hypothetical protein [Paenibacillus abyssi]|uniref:Uncharacterized protein n=1 Tax=Paenibacillus abyssi TaxID=1340531 RepID=A0A917D2K1_9BACL|nr:hypothetical protein [Paenibacillus abyssi]GGG05766.1 hypothetical protein GCM10010916_23480 [Paenibacillus abyssi]